MVRRAERIQPRRYEDQIPLPPFRTLNLFDPHSAIKDDHARLLQDYDIYSGGYIKSRRGSRNLQTILQKLGNRDVLDGVSWDVGADEYALIQQANSSGTGTEFWAGKILVEPGPWAQISTLAGPTLTFTGLIAADMFLSGDRLYIFHPLGNYIVDWNGSTFVARPMGLAPAKLLSVSAGAAGLLTGLYTYGIELLYQVDGVDIVASTPWRKTTGGRLLEVTLTAQQGVVAVDPASLALPATAGDYWNGARLWRSRDRNVNRTDPFNPRDSAGLAEELYPVQLISKADLITAGYIITDNVPDSDLPGDLTSEYPVVDIRYIELSPLPAAAAGAYHRDRIWAVPSAKRSRIVFTPSAADAYAEQYNPLSVVKAEPGDAQDIIKILSFEEDLVVLKESKTGRILNGDPNQGLSTLDHTIGIKHRKLARYVPKVGICAITNDQGEFKLLGYDLRWQNIINDIDLSRAIRTQTAAMDGTYASFLYHNGKLMVFDGTKTPYVYHSKEAAGWSTYKYAVSTAQLVLSFAGGTRACIVSKASHVVEIEVDDLDTDINTVSDSATIIEPTFEPFRFKARGGRDILEFRSYSIIAKLSHDLRAIPYVNGKSWPRPAIERETKFTPPASAYDEGDERLEREYQLTLPEPRPVGPFLHFKIKTVAPCTLQTQVLRCFVDEVGMGAGQFDPFANLSDAEATPDWIDQRELDAVDGERDTSSMQDTDALDGARDTSTMTEIDRDPT